MPNSAAAASSVPRASSFAPSAGGNLRAAKLREFLDLRRAHDGDDAGNDRDLHAELARQVIAKFKKVRVVEKQLRQHEIRARLDLLLEMLPVHLLAQLAGDVAFRKTGDADAEAALLADELHELRRNTRSRRASVEIRRPPGGSPRSARMFLQPVALIFCSNSPTCSRV